MYAVQIFPHGSTDALPYATMGSGSLNAMAVFEAGYKDDMTRDEAVALAARAIRRCSTLCSVYRGHNCCLIVSLARLMFSALAVSESSLAGLATC